MLLPGRAGSSIMWEPNLSAFAAEHPVWTVDLIGEPGRSEQTAPIRDSADQAAWLDEVLRSLDLQNVHLVGYSFGGWLAANLAIRVPDRLTSLSLIDPVQTFARIPLGLWGIALFAEAALRVPLVYLLSPDLMAGLLSLWTTWYAGLVQSRLTIDTCS